MNKRSVFCVALGAVVLLTTMGATARCEHGQTHPSAPQVHPVEPAPNPDPPALPSPSSGRKAVNIVFTVGWSGDRQFSMVYQAGTGKQRATSKTSPWVHFETVLAGQRVWVIAVPTLNSKMAGNAWCTIKTVDEKLIAMSPVVDKGSVECLGNVPR